MAKTEEINSPDENMHSMVASTTDHAFPGYRIIRITYNEFGKQTCFCEFTVPASEFYEYGQDRDYGDQVARRHFLMLAPFLEEPPEDDLADDYTDSDDLGLA